MSLPPEVEAFLRPYTPEVQALASALRAIIVEVFPTAVEQFDRPANLIGYGFDRTYKGMVCGITMHKSHVNLMLARGAEVPDPKGLLTGTGKSARHVKLTSAEDLAPEALKALLRAAVALPRRK